MTAMLDEPEWSHLDQKIRKIMNKIIFFPISSVHGNTVSLYLAQTSKEMWKLSLSWWAAGSSSSMGARRFRLSSERLSARLRERDAEYLEVEDEEEGCRRRSCKGSFRSTLSWKAGFATGSGTL